MPRLLKIHIVLNLVKMLNFIPTKGVIPDNMIPKNIMSGKNLDYKIHLSLQLGQYFQVHKEKNTSKSQVQIIKESFALVPAPNTAKKICQMELGLASHDIHGDLSSQYIERQPNQKVNLHRQSQPYNWICRNHSSGCKNTGIRV